MVLLMMSLVKEDMNKIDYNICGVSPTIIFLSFFFFFWDKQAIRIKKEKCF